MQPFSTGKYGHENFTEVDNFDLKWREKEPVVARDRKKTTVVTPAVYWGPQNGRCKTNKCYCFMFSLCEFCFSSFPFLNLGKIFYQPSLVIVFVVFSEDPTCNFFRPRQPPSPQSPSVSRHVSGELNSWSDTCQAAGVCWKVVSHSSACLFEMFFLGTIGQNPTVERAVGLEKTKRKTFWRGNNYYKWDQKKCNLFTMLDWWS